MPLWGNAVVTLDGSDSIRSALAKLEGSAGDVQVVVISPGCRIAESPLTYRLLARASERHAAPMAVVTGNPAWRQMAREHGLRAFPSLGSLQRSRRHSPLAPVEGAVDALLSSLHPSSLKQVWPVFVVVLAVVGIGAFFLLPVMTVTLRAPVKTVSEDVDVKVDVTTSKVDAASMTIPGRTIEYHFSVSDFVATTGEKQVGKERAKGEVTIINSSSVPVTVPAGTTLSSASGVKFTTGAAVTVGPYLSGSPTLSQGPVPVGGGVAIKVPVVAVEPGEKGNVPALGISKIEGNGFQNLTVINEQPLTGGTDAKVRTVSADDRAKLKESLFQKAQSQSLSELTLRVGQSETLIPHSMNVQIDGEQYDKAVDDEADQLRGTVYVVASGMAFANQDLNSVIESYWRKSTAKGYQPLPGDLTIAPPEVKDAGSRSTTLTVKVTGKAEPVVDTNKLTNLLRGTSVSEARSKLASLEGGFGLQAVQIWPQWAPRAYRIEVETVQ
jgi:hypothetical protein